MKIYSPDIAPSFSPACQVAIVSRLLTCFAISTHSETSVAGPSRKFCLHNDSVQANAKPFTAARDQIKIYLDASD